MTLSSQYLIHNCNLLTYAAKLPLGALLITDFLRSSGDGGAPPPPPAPPAPVYLSIRILGARHLSRGKSGRGLLSPFVEVEVLGAEYDNAKVSDSQVQYWKNPTFSI